MHVGVPFLDDATCKYHNISETAGHWPRPQSVQTSTIGSTTSLRPCDYNASPTTNMAQSQLSSPSRQPCHLQEKLPAELRNEIYELLFNTSCSETSLDNDAETVDLFHATPPSKALTLTCRQFQAEARDMYRMAYRSYWKSTSFTVNVDTMTHESIAKLRKEDLQHITKLKTTRTTPHRTSHIAEMITPDGIWHDTHISHTWDHDEYYVMTAESSVGCSHNCLLFLTESRALECLATAQGKLTMKEQLAKFLSLRAVGR